uniref:MLO-like protein n=1 Tax=Lactuca sativa TaxID=4236 RepID=A0A9R1W7H8_LACSA|nr:hypothetical protein LSAT_V11C300129680 [Lactuca sativa]
MEADEGKSLVETPTWAVASVVSVMVLVGFFMNAALRHIEKWLYRTKRKALFAALEKIKEELMLFAILSLLMGHWIVYISKICVKSSAISSRFYPCSIDKSFIVTEAVDDRISFNNHSNYSVSRQLLSHTHTQICPEGSSSFASKESLEQLHRFLFALGVTHVTYSFVAIALAMIKIYSWRIWENQAKSMAQPPPQGMRRLSTFIYRNTAHPWSQHNILVWLLCFSRQIWSSINRTDYLALRLGFITTHNLPLSYDFHNYMLRSMEEEFRDIVGISIPLWIFAISCVLLGFHGTYIYFWLSFLPAIWEVNETSCFTKDHSVLMIRLTFGIVSQFWCSFITFPLYMGSQFKKTIVSENVRESLHTWRRRVKEKHRHDSTFALLPATSSTMSLDSMVDDDYDEIVPISSPDDFFEESQSQVLEVSTHDENAQLVPGRDDDNDCDEIDISCDSERFEPYT